MHKCTVCDRQFASKGALTRHEQNHRKTQQYTCPHCEVSFYRSDLLSRHSVMHEEAGSTGLEGRKKRLRSRTACEACRHARTKCDGQSPCLRCQKQRLTCSFIPKGGRISTDLRITDLSGSSPDTNMIVDSNQGKDMESTNASTVYYQADVSLHCDSSSVPVEVPNDGSNDEAALNVVSPYVISWPWLHEDTFLQTDINLDWYDVPEPFINEDEGTMNGGFGLSQPICSTFNDREMLTGNSCEQSGHEHMAGSNHNVACEDATHIISKAELVNTIVEQASTLTKHIFDSNGDCHTIRAFETEVGVHAAYVPLVFQFDTWVPNTDAKNLSHHCLRDFVQLYLKHFRNLWPLFPQYECKNHNFQPLLYLAMTSIGAMYGGKKASEFGTMLHESLRDILLRPFFEYDTSDPNLLPLGQARSLTQAAALYFGQKKAFSYAQHIGGILVSQGRKMNIFSVKTYTVANENDSRTDEQRLVSWIRNESCKRLAFAILRLEMYTSILHSTRPLISAEEMDIELPCSRFLWDRDFSCGRDFMNAVQQEHSMKQHKVLFSDLVRLMLDPKERLPQLDFLDQELLMNATQEYVWRACAARDSFERLIPTESMFELELDTGFQDEDNVVRTLRTTQSNSLNERDTTDSHLIRYVRAMSSLQRTNLEASKALRKWHESCSSSEIPTQVADRSSLLSCLLIYHTGFLQLHAPLELIHTICYFPLSTRRDQHGAVSKVRSWFKTERSLVAVRHAMSIFQLLKYEARKALTSRAMVNFLTMTGLYHSAALLWVYSGVTDDKADTIGTSSDWHKLELDCGDSQIRISRTHKSLLMDAFVALFFDINPAWAPRSSFCAAVQRLSKLDFPDG